MDRPEDIEPSPVTGRIYVACTMPRIAATPARPHWNGRVVDTGVNAANPRPDNRSGHIIEITEAGDDATATRFNWDVFLMAGDPSVGRFIVDARDLAAGKSHGPKTPTSRATRIAPRYARLHCPDNLGIDPQGRLWIVSDTDDHGRPNNGCFVVPTTGPRARPAAPARQRPHGLRGLRLRIHARWPHAVPVHPAPGRRRQPRQSAQPLAGRERAAGALHPAGHRARGPCPGLADSHESEMTRGTHLSAPVRAAGDRRR